MLAYLCNNCRLFCSLQVMLNLAWHHFTAHLLDNTSTNNIDHFTEYDGDKDTKSEIYFNNKVNP